MEKLIRTQKGVVAICGRYLVLDEGEVAEINKIVQEIGMKYDGKGLSMKTGEIFPTDTAPVVSFENSKPTLHLMKWGFPRQNAKGAVINSRSETVSKKRMFAASYRQSRIVVPSTGFYEWASLDGKTKQKFLFNTPSSQMLYMAGISASFTTSAIPEPTLGRFVILTRQANDSIEDIHNRMPVILYKDEIKQWLADLDFADSIISRNSVYLIRRMVS